MLSLVLHTPPVSVNDLYQGRRFLTQKGRDTKERLAWEAKMQYKKPPLEGEVCVQVRFFAKNGRSDVDNILKGTLDSLSGILWKDDKQITDLHVYKKVDKENPRIEIEAQTKTAP